MIVSAPGAVRGGRSLGPFDQRLVWEQGCMGTNLGMEIGRLSGLPNPSKHDKTLAVKRPSE